MHDHDIRPLVQAPMKSPLNLAHTYSRKADMFTKSRKYNEAIACHQTAAEYLLQAMNITKSPTLLDSMALQHKAYLSQIDKLHAKSQLLELMDRTAKTTSTVSRATQTDDIHNVETKQLVAVDEGTVCQILRENDDVIHQFSQINGQKLEDGQGAAEKCPFTIMGQTNLNMLDVQTMCKSTNTKKVSREDGHTLTEMTCSFDEVVKMNEKLSSTVRSLIRELNSNKMEKKQLEQKLGGSSDQMRQGFEEALKFSSLDLPPLEVSYPELINFNVQS
ncbi:nuclear receptor-binding factor 2 [Plakobranchus ocellatus]|uniref:Nuclear receptor-binding factor 2 n=1 Tax=Plakobranchus ocellatus TaxID=259542 RepID=A0AAV4DQZ5_9GAST|nr:nuclear receptor-binding factor 2 [Plakobranchus ocellatus]